MTIHNLEKTSSILNKFIAELRDIHIQKDTMRFRRNIERIGEILGYELSKSLLFTKENVETPLGNREIEFPQTDIVLCSILRAGLPLHQGLLNYFDDAENAFISAYRRHKNNKDEFDIIVEYFAAPSIENKTVILADPMLATGKSLVAVHDAIKKHGNPEQLHLVSVIGAKAGIELIRNHFPKNTHLWIASVDEKLNAKGYIIPGLGDAGDLSFGEKL